MLCCHCFSIRTLYYIFTQHFYSQLILPYPHPPPAHVAPSLIKSGGSVISYIVLRDLLLPESDRSSQTSLGQTDRNSLPCRHQSPLLLTIILICAFPLVFAPGTLQCLLPTTRKECLTVMVADSQIHLCCFQHHRCKLQDKRENLAYVINTVGSSLFIQVGLYFRQCFFTFWLLHLSRPNVVITTMP